jgi:hypothetical protein
MTMRFCAFAATRQASIAHHTSSLIARTPHNQSLRFEWIRGKFIADKTINQTKSDCVGNTETKEISNITKKLTTTEH